MITVVINGKPRDLEPGTTIAALLGQLGHRRETVAVAINTTFVPRSQHDTTRLNAGDRVDIVGPMQGG